MTLVRSGSVLAIGITIGLSLLAQELLLRASADQIQVSAPRLHFISGKPLERLKNGDAVAFDFNLTVLNETKESILRRNFDRFVVSYDIWEEKFSVSRMRSGRSSAHSNAAP